MKITEARNGLQSRKVLIGCAVSRVVLAAVAERWDDKEGLFDSRPANIIGNWCVQHYRKYAKAPGKSLESVYDSWSSQTKDKELAKQVEHLMIGLSKEYQSGKAKIQEAFTIDAAGKLFKAIQLRRRNREIEALLESGDTDKATALAETFTPIQMGSRSWVKATVADNGLKEALRKAKELPLVTYPGAMGEFFGSVFRRGGFAVYEGPEKRGKTVHLTDLSFRAISKGLKVAFFAVGDMSLDEMRELFSRRITGHPMYGDPTKFQYPLALTISGGSPEVAFEERERETLNFATSRKAWNRFNAKMGTDDLLRLAAYPNYSISILGLKAELQAWQRHGWNPDLCVIDYLDLLTPCTPGKSETRDQIDETWKRTRALAQVFNCCVVSASQTDAASYSAEVIGMSNFSGSKTKNAHVTAMIGLNQTDEEKEIGVMRYNLVVLRRGKSVGSKVCYAVGCPNIGNPVILSSLI